MALKGIFGSEANAEDKYQFIGLMIFIGLIFWAQLRLTILLMIPFSIWEFLFYGGIAYFLQWLVVIHPKNKKQEAQREASKGPRNDSIIGRQKREPDSKMLGFKRIWELEIDWDDDGSLIGKIHSKEYKDQYYTLVSGEHSTNINEISEEQKRAENTLLSLMQKFSTQMKDSRTKDTDLFNTKENLLTSLSKINEDGTVKQQNEVQEESKANLANSMKELITLDDFDIEDLLKTDDLKEQKKIIKQLRFYYAILVDKEKFDGQEKEWDEVFLIMPGDYRVLLETHVEEGTHAGWSVLINNCYSFWAHAWDYADFPVLYLMFSENMIKPAIEHILNLKSSGLAYMQLKVMENWMNNLAVKPEKLEAMINDERQRANAFRDALTDTILSHGKDNVRFSRLLKNPVQDALISKIEKYKRWFYLAISGILLSIITFTILLAFSF